MTHAQARIFLAFWMLLLLAGSGVSGEEPRIVLLDAFGRFQTSDTEADPVQEPAEENSPEDRPETGEDVQEKKSDSAEPAEQRAEESQQSAEPTTPAKPPLTAELAALRDQLRRTLSAVYGRSVDAGNNLPAEVIAFCEAFGHTAEIASSSRSRQKVNAIGALCWNYPCAGYRLLRTDGERIVARVGYGYQTRPSQLLAMLAQTRVPASYEVRVGEHRGTVADLVASEQRACRAGLDQSGTLIAMARYAEADETWQNGPGESWSVERLLDEELDREADAGRIDVVNRLMAISFALKKLEGEKLANESLRQRAEKHVEEYHDYALDLQNADGSWHPGFFAYRGTSKDAEGSLLSTGAILTWLVYSLPEQRLEDERILRGLRYLDKQLAHAYRRRSGPASSAREVLAHMKAARALALFDRRYLEPRTPEEPAEADEASTAQARSADRSTTVSRSASRPAPSRYSPRSPNRSASRQRRR